MKALNTTLKGNLFENQVYEILKKELENENFYLNGKKSKIFQKKPYYSRDREKFIVFDLSIETYLNGSDKYSMLTIIECKNYDKKVPVDDVEEFDSKLRQIGEHNIKGFMISPFSFDTGGITFAKNKGITLARVTSKNTLDWVNLRKDRITQNYDFDTIKSYLSGDTSNKSFFAFSYNKSFESLSDFLIHLKVIDKYVPRRKDIRIPYRSEEDIIKKIQLLTTDDLYIRGRLDSDVLCRNVSKSFNIRFNFGEKLDFDKNSKVLGRLNFNPLEIYVSSDLLLTNDDRWRFTLAHEIGHLLFHYRILKNYLDENTDTAKSLSFGDEVSDELNKNMEVQANVFASNLLLPLDPLLDEVNKYFINENIRNRPYLYLDSQPCNLSLVHNLLYKLKLKFGVSKEAIKYRLMKLQLIRENFD